MTPEESAKAKQVIEVALDLHREAREQKRQVRQVAREIAHKRGLPVDWLLQMGLLGSKILKLEKTLSSAIQNGDLVITPEQIRIVAAQTQTAQREFAFSVLFEGADPSEMVESMQKPEEGPVRLKVKDPRSDPIMAKRAVELFWEIDKLLRELAKLTDAINIKKPCPDVLKLTLGRIERMKHTFRLWRSPRWHELLKEERDTP